MKAGLVGTANFLDLARDFQHSHYFRLTHFLHPELLQIISSRLEHSVWITQTDGEIAQEAVPSNPGPASILNFAANTPELLDLIRLVTGCHDIKSFVGRVYRMEQSANHYDSWHADIGSTHHDRLVGMSINLSPRPYQGGVLLLRDETSGRIMGEVSNTGAGDAIFFRISPALKHMITPLAGTEPKTAFAGWFKSGGTDFYSTLRIKNVRTSEESSAKLYGSSQ